MYMEDLDEDSEEDLLEDALEDPLEDLDQWPDRVEDVPAYVIKSLVVPINEYLEPNEKNEILNMSKQILTTLIPQADPRLPREIVADGQGPVEGRDALPRNFARSDTAPTLKGPGQQHKVVLRGGRPRGGHRDSRRRDRKSVV